MSQTKLINLKFPKDGIVFHQTEKKKTFKSVSACVEMSQYKQIAEFAKSNNITINELIKTLLLEFIKANTAEGDK